MSLYAEYPKHFSKEKAALLKKICSRIKYIHRHDDIYGKYIIEKVDLCGNTGICDHYYFVFTVGSEGDWWEKNGEFIKRVRKVLERFLVNYIYPPGNIKLDMRVMRYDFDDIYEDEAICID